METALKEFHNSLTKFRAGCPWKKDESFEKLIIELEKEVVELKQATENCDVENMHEELGDVLFDALTIGVLAEEKGLFTLKEVIEEVHDKLVRRAPWVFGDETVSGKEEAIKRWDEIKRQEKETKRK